MRLAIEIQEHLGGRAVAAKPRQDCLNAGLDKRVCALRADAQFDAGAVPEVDPSLVIGVEAEGRSGRVHGRMPSFRCEHLVPDGRGCPTLDVCWLARPADT